MLGHIFYTIGLFLFFLSLVKTINYFKFIDIKEWVVKFNEKIKRSPKKEEYRSEKDYNTFSMFGCLIVIETFWFILGLLTPNWIIFGSVLTVSFLSKPVLDKLPYTLQKIIGFTLNLIRTLLIIILVINHFHLHLNLIQVLF